MRDTVRWGSSAFPQSRRQKSRLSAAADGAIKFAAILPVLSVFVFAAVVAAGRRPQDWFRTGTGLGVEKARVAVADAAPANPGSQPLAQLFTDTLRADLEYSGILELVSKSFQPQAAPGRPGALNAAEWTAAPANAQFVAYGTLTASGNALGVDAWLSDVRAPAAPPAIGKRYPGSVTTEDVRRVAHQFADEIVLRLSGGVTGIAMTRIAFVSSRSGNKEIWTMDYDGQNQQQITRARTIAVTPRWSPDDSRIAYTCFSGTFQICMYSMELGRPVAFQHYGGTNASPSWSPDGTKLMFMSSVGGSPNIYSADAASGTGLKRITTSGGPDASPVWNPKTGQQVAFVSGRGGLPQLYVMNADGTNMEKVDLPDMGYVVDPDWSPNGQLLAFSWRRPDGNFDIYVMDIASHKLAQVTRDAARNEKPSWAPDGRHLVFQSTRTGRWQIWTMLADGSEPRQLTTEGQNESPNWSPK
jgi:TolB protein